MTRSDPLLAPLRSLLDDLQLPGLEPGFRLVLLGQGTYHRVYGAGSVSPRFVVRVRVHEDAASTTAIEAEHRALKALDGLHAPRSYHVDASCKRFPYPFRIEDFCEGVSPAEFTPALVRDLARALAAIHARRYRRSGAFPGSEDNYVPGGRMAVRLASRTTYSPPGRELAATLRQRVERARHRYRGFARFSLVHNDIHLGNLRLHRGRLTLIDWEHTTVADPAVDIAILFWFSAVMGGVAGPLSPELRSMFFSEYQTRTGDGDIEERVAIHEPIALLLQLLASDAQLTRPPPHLRADDLSGPIERARRYLAFFGI